MAVPEEALIPDIRPSLLDRWQLRVRSSLILRRRIDVLAPVIVTVLAGLLRLIGLGHPHELVFDETYYVKDAWSQWNLGYPADWPDKADAQFNAGQTDIFQTTGSFVVHPPLGKWIIGAGMWLFGPDSSFGWRIGSALFGTATVLLVYLLAKRLTRSTVFATVAGLLMAIDGLSIVLSRVSLLDGFLTFFIVLAMLFAVIDRERHLARLAAHIAAGPGERDWGPMLWARPWLFAAGAAAGAACAVKWSGLYVLAAIGIYAVVTDALARRRAGIRFWPQDAIRQGAASFLLLVPIAFVVYLSSWTGWLVTDGGYDRQSASNPFAALWIYHEAIYAFHVGLSTPHSYASPAWQWPFLIRPTSMFWHQDPVGTAGCTWDSGCVQAISSIPNPLIWWLGIIAAAYLVFAFALRRDWRYAVVLTGIAATYLPWLAFPERTIFQFYTVAMVPFLVLALTFALREVAGRRSRSNRRRVTGQRFVWVVLGAAIVLSAFWYPVWVGMPVPYDFWLVHNWSRTWI